MGEYFNDDKYREEMHKGLLLLGWRVDSRFTSEDEARIKSCIETALSLHVKGELTSDKIDKLSLSVYKTISFQIMNVEERAIMISRVYSSSTYLKPLVSLIDQATACFYHGYYTSALATLFIILESYLRNLIGWKPGDENPSFLQLREAVCLFPDSPERRDAEAMLKNVYDWYHADSPPQFYFNRHGLLHGMRKDFSIYDHMNCVRIYLLLDLLCHLEEVDCSGYIFDEHNDIFRKRVAYFKQCMGSD